MPTGYTAAVGEGKISTLREFALQCARGMGACITMRDDPWDAPIPDAFEPNTSYHDEALAKAKTLLDEADRLSDAECEARSEKDYSEALASHKKYASELNEENSRYRKMLEAVSNWTTEAEGIKEFMTDQLEISISTYQPVPPTAMTGSQWREASRAAALRSIAYHETAIAEEVHRVQMRNLWLGALRRSLPANA